MITDWRSALANDSLMQKLLPVETNSFFKDRRKELFDADEYEEEVLGAMYPHHIPLQVIPFQRGPHRSVQVFPLHGKGWFDHTRKQLQEPSIWKTCCWVASHIQRLITAKGVKMPRQPFVVIKEHRSEDGGPERYFTPQDLRIPGLTYLPLEPIRDRSAMRNIMEEGVSADLPMRLIWTKPKNGKGYWFWEPVAYLSSLRLEQLTVTGENKMEASLYGRIDKDLIRIPQARVSTGFQLELLLNAKDYVDREMLVRFTLRDYFDPIASEENIATMQVINPLVEDLLDFDEDNRVLAV